MTDIGLFGIGIAGITDPAEAKRNFCNRLGYKLPLPAQKIRLQVLCAVVCSVQCAVCRVQCAVCRVPFAVCRVRVHGITMGMYPHTAVPGVLLSRFVSVLAVSVVRTLSASCYTTGMGHGAGHSEQCTSVPLALILPCAV